MRPPEVWFHAKHGLHDEAHHQHHNAMDVCVPLDYATPERRSVSAEADGAVSRIHDLRLHVDPDHVAEFDAACWVAHDILRAALQGDADAPLTGNHLAIAVVERLGFDPTNHHNAARCPYCSGDADAPVGGLAFAQFAAVNRERCEAPDGFNHPLSAWSVSDWFLAATGEFGEAANKAKKLNRVRDGIPGNTETPDELRAGLADEIADAVIYLDLLAQSQGFDLGSIVTSKFNRTSEKNGMPHRLAAAHPQDPPGPEKER